jgi:chromate reductase
MIDILAFSGSTRSDSFNKKILKISVQGARDAGANVTVIDLLEYELPLYDGDLERDGGIPSNGTKLKKLFLAHQGILLALPEYNSSFSAVFKNVIDWVSRPTPEEIEPLSCFKNKIAALTSASTGKLGGMRGLVHARAMLENINVMVIPTQVCVANAPTLFDERDNLKDKKLSQSLENLGAELADLIKKIHIIPMHEKNMTHFTSKKLLSEKIKGPIQVFENEGGLIGLGQSPEPRVRDTKFIQ